MNRSMTPPLPDAEMVERMVRLHQAVIAIDGTPRAAMDAVLNYLDLPAIRAESHRAGMEAMRERTAAVIRDNQEVVEMKGNRRVLAHRNDGDRHALAYADAIMAIPLDPTPASAVAGGES